ncbi:hypothetical protein ACTFIY_009338 [Dictyostelium cf. discoideum]
MDILYFKVFKNKYINKKIWSFVKRYDETSKRYDEIISISELLSLHNKNKIKITDQDSTINSLIELLKYKIKRGDIILFDFKNIQQLIQVFSKNEQIKHDREFFRCLVTYYKEELIFIPNLLESFCKYGNLIALEEITNLEKSNNNNKYSNNIYNNNNKINKIIYYENYKVSKKAFDLAIEVGEFKIMDFLFKNRNEGYTERDILENIFLESNSSKMCLVFLKYALNTMSIDLSKCKSINIDCYYHLQDDFEIANKLNEFGLIHFQGISYLYHNIPFPILNTPNELLNIVKSFLFILKKYIYTLKQEEDNNEDYVNESFEYPIPKRPPIEQIENFINNECLFTNEELELDIILNFKETDKRIEKLIHWYIVLFESYGLFTESVDLIYSYIAKYSETIEDKQLVNRIFTNSNDWDQNLIFTIIFLNCNFNLFSSFFNRFKNNNNFNSIILDGIKIGISSLFEINSNEKILQFLQSFYNNYNFNSNLKNEILNIIYKHLKSKLKLESFYQLFDLLPIEFKEYFKNSLNDETTINNNINNNNITTIIIPQIESQSLIEKKINYNDYGYDKNKKMKIDPIELIKLQRFEELFEEYFNYYDDETKALLENEKLYIEIGNRCVQFDELLDRFIKVLINFNLIENSKEFIINSILIKSIKNGFLKNLQYFLTTDNRNLFKISNEIIIKNLLNSAIINDNISIVSYLLSILFPFLFFNNNNQIKSSQTIPTITKEEKEFLLSTYEQLNSIKLTTKMENYLKKTMNYK